jgi:hypothetical protein
VDLTDTAREAGIRVPVAITAAAWGEAIRLTSTATVQGCDLRGRTWDVLWLLRCAMLRHRDGSRLTYTVGVVQDHPRPVPVALTAICGPGDDGAPVLTILLPGED